MLLLGALFALYELVAFGVLMLLNRMDPGETK